MHAVPAAFGEAANRRAARASGKSRGNMAVIGQGAGTCQDNGCMLSAEIIYRQRGRQQLPAVLPFFLPSNFWHHRDLAHHVKRSSTLSHRR